MRWQVRIGHAWRVVNETGTGRARLLQTGVRRFWAIPITVHAAAILFAACMVGFLVLYPTFYGFDEPQHVDRVYATTDGEL